MDFMQRAPLIGFTEFNFHTTLSCEANGFSLTERNHPDFGYWRERKLTLDHINIYEHRATLAQAVNVQFDEDSTGSYVHHCISLEGKMGAHFRNANIAAELSPQKFHQLYIPENEYVLGLCENLSNVHIEIDREYYVDLLGESESWSAKLRNSLSEQKLFYPGEQALSVSMMHTLHEMFNSPLSGSLKRLLIEAKVHELVALQLNTLFEDVDSGQEPSANRDLFYAIRDYLMANFLKELTLKEIARNFGINEFKLKKGFRENFKTTVFEFLLGQRLEYAREQLLYTPQTVHEISSLVGYKYANHFSTAFKKRFGICPGSLKR